MTGQHLICSAAAVNSVIEDLHFQCSVPFRFTCSQLCFVIWTSVVLYGPFNSTILRMKKGISRMNGNNMPVRDGGSTRLLQCCDTENRKRQ